MLSVPNNIILPLAIANFLNKYPTQARTCGNLIIFSLTSKQKLILKCLLLFINVAKISEKLQEVSFYDFLPYIVMLLFLLHKLVERENMSKISRKKYFNLFLSP